MDGWAALRALVWIGVLVATTCAQAADFELIGHMQPAQPLPVYLQGASTPFNAHTEADLNGRFHFRKLLAGAYVLMVGGLQRTVEVGPSLADSKGRVSVTFDLRDTDAEPSFERRGIVSVRELSIPKEARREYEDAQKALERRDVPAAVAHVKRALDLAPQFSAAWNHLGTIAYQTGQYVEAEADFRKGLEADPDAYAPLVNLGGVLINLAQLGRGSRIQPAGYAQQAQRRAGQLTARHGLFLFRQARLGREIPHGRQANRSGALLASSNATGRDPSAPERARCGGWRVAGLAQAAPGFAERLQDQGGGCAAAGRNQSLSVDACRLVVGMRPGSSVSIGQNEFLNAFAGIHFTRIEVSVRVHGDRVDPVELPRHAAVVADRAHHSAVFAVMNPDLVVGAVCDQHVLLLRDHARR